LDPVFQSTLLKDFDRIKTLLDSRESCEDAATIADAELFQAFGLAPTDAKNLLKPPDGPDDEEAQ
jgi:hypothetical protein